MHGADTAPDNKAKRRANSGLLLVAAPLLFIAPYVVALVVTVANPLWSMGDDAGKTGTTRMLEVLFPASRALALACLVLGVVGLLANPRPKPAPSEAGAERNAHEKSDP
jgi:hypothetical protein